MRPRQSGGASPKLRGAPDVRSRSCCPRPTTLIYLTCSLAVTERHESRGGTRGTGIG